MSRTMAGSVSGWTLRLVVFAVSVICAASPATMGQDNVWAPLGPGMLYCPVRALTVYNDRPVAGTDCDGAVLQWSGTNWWPMGYMGGRVCALTVWNYGVVAGGEFWPGYIAAYWNGNWGPLGAMNAPVRALALFNGELIAGGDFTTADGAACNYIARWNGSSWQPLGGGMNGTVYALATFNNELIAGGSFTTADGGTCNRVARWNGSMWQSLGTGSANGTDGPVYALASHPSGLILGGDFTHAGPSLRTRIARWTGSAWPLFGSFDAPVYALTLHYAAGGQVLIAGGDFTSAAGMTCYHIARLASAPAWQPLLTGYDPATNGTNGPVYALADYRWTYDNPWPDALIVGGDFTGAGNLPCTYVAGWGPAAGACCLPYNNCLEVSPGDCSSIGGTYLANWLTCDPNPCTQPGACCFDDGHCEMSTVTAPGDCAPGGTYLGDNTDCDPNPCPQPGACCQPDGTCAVTFAVNCTGVWQGVGTTCSPNPCPQPGACCQPNGSCAVTTQAACGAPGVWHGEWTSCDPNPCPYVKGDVNCDHAVNTADIPYFVAALIGGYAGCDITLADMNDSGAADGADIQPFVNALLGT